MTERAMLKGYTVAHKEYVVVMRSALDRCGRGVIVKQFDTKKEAQNHVIDINDNLQERAKDYWIWVIPKDEWLIK